MKRTLIYTDTQFIEQIKHELEMAQDALQRMLDTWNGLDMVPVTNLWELMISPNTVYTRAVGEIGEATVSHGRFQIKKDVFINLVQAPVPNELYLACNNSKLCSMTGHPELWSVSEDGKTVILDQAKADLLIYDSDIYVENEKQKEFAENILTFLKTTNWLHDNMPLLPGLGMRYGYPYALIERSSQFVNKLELQPSELRELLKSLI
jgi:hypothetical protein